MIEKAATTPRLMKRSSLVSCDYAISKVPFHSTDLYSVPNRGSSDLVRAHISASERLGLRFWFCHLPASWCWASYLTLLYFCFSIFVGLLGGFCNMMQGSAQHLAQRKRSVPWLPSLLLIRNLHFWKNRQKVFLQMRILPSKNGC